MSTLPRAALFAAATIAFSLAAACSSTPNPGGPDSGKQDCPTSIAQATASTTKCQVENTICVVGFPCSPVYQQATCTCDTSTGWRCLTSDGKTVPPDTTATAPLCQPVSASNPNACPTTQTSGPGTPCTEPGQTCYYSGVKCTGDQFAATDNCQCKGNSMGDAGLSWVCEVSSCP